MPTTDPPDAEVLIRPAGLDDADAIADLYTAARIAAVPFMPPALHTNAEDRRWFVARLSDGEHEAWVAEGEDLLGFALITPTWLHGLYVDPAHRGEGIGSALLDLVKSLRPDGFGLWVFESNTPARAFYARHGLVEVERTDGAENEERAPDIRMVFSPGGAHP